MFLLLQDKKIREIVRGGAHKIKIEYTQIMQERYHDFYDVKYCHVAVICDIINQVYISFSKRSFV